MGTQFDLFHDLKNTLQELGETHSVEGVKGAIRQYWEESSNRDAREPNLTGEESGNAYLKNVLSFFEPPSALDFSIGWPTVVDSAGKDPLALEAIKNLAADWLDSGKEIPAPIREITARILRNEFNPNRRGRRPDPHLHHRDLQLGLAVHSLREVFGSQYTLERHGVKLNNAYGIVEAATGEDFEIVRNAYKKLKKRLSPKKGTK